RCSDAHGIPEREARKVSCLRNATVHALFAGALTETRVGYRLYWGVYVQPVSRLTPLYMALIDPFRRFIVYPAVLRRIRRAWEERYPGSSIPVYRLNGGRVPSLVEKRSGAFFRLVKCTTNAPPCRAATGGTRHGQGYQGRSAGAGA